MSRANEPAYPVEPITGTHSKEFAGLTLREHFAGLAMQGLLDSEVVMRLSDKVLEANPTLSRGEWIASQAVGFADALIAELARPQGATDERA